MRAFRIKASTALRLGALSVGRVGLYRVGLKIGLNPVKRLKADTPAAPFYLAACGPIVSQVEARTGWFDHAEAFGRTLHRFDRSPPLWVAGCLSGASVEGCDRDWWQIPDFDPAVGDIKAVWEFSRFDWVLACAQHAALGCQLALQRLNDWLTNWLQANPPFKGPNWKCGQEASIRVMHLAFAAKIMAQIRNASVGLLDLVELHLQRIAPTLMYAVAQDNNHGTSEAAALFIGGAWLEANGRTKGRKYSRSGRKWLENRVRQLVEDDGSFSQYSLNYHRVMLDTLSMAEFWRRELTLTPFSSKFYSRAAVATEWLRYMTNPDNGDGPNVGANDGARLLPLTDTDYRDYRPSVQLASVLFQKARAFSGEGLWNQPIYWLGLKLPEAQLPPLESRQFDDGGYFVLRDTPVMVLLRYPRFRFRPAQADALHVDLWIDAENWLRDGGSYSYNTEKPWLEYFPGTAAHNTVQFDDRDQMPRLSRFLFGAWLKARGVEPLSVVDGRQECGAGYRDWKGAGHHRRIELTVGTLKVEDQVEGFRAKAVLRWRLRPGDWRLDVGAQRIESGGLSLTVSATIPIKRFEVIEGWESRYYLQKTVLPVLEIEVDQPGVITTTIQWMTA